MSVKKPLEGLRIVEYCAWIAAPGGLYMLADLGAEVIKVEDMLGDGDPYRRIGVGVGAPIKGEDGTDMNPWFDNVNYNKNYVCINTKTPDGKAAFYKLLATADAFVTSYRQDVLTRRGLDYDTLHERFPKLPYVHFLGFGEYGPLKDKAAFDVTTYFAAGGYLANSVPDYSEYLGNYPFAGSDCWSAGNVAFAATTGILESKLNGQGDYFTLSLYGEAYWSQRLSMIQCQFGLKHPRDPLDPPNPVVNNYKSKDGRWMVLCISDYNRYYKTFMHALGHDELANDPVFCDLGMMNAEGKKHEVINAIAESFGRYTAAELHALLDPLDIPLEDCATYYEMLESEQGWANQYMEKIEYPTGDSSIAFTQPVSSRNAGRHAFHRSRSVGADNNRYLGELGYSQAQIDALRSSGVIK